MISIYDLFRSGDSPSEISILFEYNTISTSEHSEYVPLFVGKKGKILKTKDKKVVIYSLYLKSNYPDQKPSVFLHNLIYGTNTAITFKNNQKYFLLKHCVYYFDNNDTQTEPRILWTLAVKSDHFFDINFKNPDMSKFVLLVSNELFDPKHRVAKLKFNAYLKDVEALGIDVLYTNDVNRRCLVNGFEKPKFNTVSDMKQYMHDLQEHLVSNLIGVKTKNTSPNYNDYPF